MPYLEEQKKENYKTTKNGKIKNVIIKYFPTEEESSSLNKYFNDTGVTVTDLIQEKINEITNIYSPSDKAAEFNYQDEYSLEEVNDEWDAFFEQNNIKDESGFFESELEEDVITNRKRKELVIS